jgi:hypothetical protein
MILLASSQPPNPKIETKKHNKPSLDKKFKQKNGLTNE